MKKRIVSLFLALVMVLGMLPMAAFAADAPAQDEDGAYLLGSTDDLLWFAEAVNTGSTAICGRLTANIDMSEQTDFIGIGTSADNAYCGTFDGNGFQVNVNITRNTSYGGDPNGLFVFVGKATIRDLTMTGAMFGYMGAGIVGRAIDELTIEDCVNTATITGDDNIAGIVGNATAKVTILNCVNKATIGSSQWAGNNRGGIAGSLSAPGSVVRGCRNEGNVITGFSSGRCGAGIVAYTTSSEEAPTVIENCANTGAVTNSYHIGGIVGHFQGAGGSVKSCYNTGKMSGKSTSSRVGVGGIVGTLESNSLTDVYNTGAVVYAGSTATGTGGIVGVTEKTCTITNAYNTGAVTCSKATNGGGLVGWSWAEGVTLTNCHWLTGTYTNGTGTGTNGKPIENVPEAETADEMKALAATLGDGFQESCGNYPVLSWQEAVAHTFGDAATNRDGATHSVTCTVCNTVMNQDCVDEDGNGVCDTCGATIGVVIPIVYLAELAVGSTRSAKDYEMTKVDEWNYTVTIPESKSNFFLWATLSEDAPAGATITAKWVNRNVDEAKTQAVTSGSASGVSLTGAATPSGLKNTVTVEAGTGDDIQTFNIEVIRTDPTITALTLQDADGAAIALNETFLTSTKAYTATTLASSVTISATPKNSTEYTVTYNGGESNTIALADGANTIEIVVTNADGFSTTYTLTVTKTQPAKVTFKLTPEDAVVNLQDRFGARIWPDENGAYTVMAGVDYSATVAKLGYVGQASTVNVTEDAEIAVTLTKAEANSAINPTIQAEWPMFRKTEDHLGVTDARTPTSTEDSELLWAAKFGNGYGGGATAAPLLVDGYMITYSSTNLFKVNPDTGAIVATGTMVGSSSFAINPPTYADGMIFVGLAGGTIQAFNADTLESLWVYKDSLGGQPNTSPSYKDGMLYVGFWNNETRDAHFVGISTTDEDPTQTNETKLATWSYTRAGGFYWAGAYVSDKYVVVGSDDGMSGYSSETASLLVLDRFTGRLVDSVDDIRGDIRSNVSYDASSNRVFFTTKGGLLCNAVVDWETGKISDMHRTVIVNSKGTEYAMSTCTPSVYNDRIYIGVCGNGQFTSNSGHGIAVYDLAEDGTMTQAYVYDIVGYPQTSAMLTTAYEEEEGYVYIYLPYNYTPGGISVLKDQKGQTEPITTSDSGYSEVFTPQSPLAQYCICSTIADEYGTIYYKNDSAYMMAITSKILDIEVTACGKVTENEDGTITAENLKVVSNLANGLARDVSDYVTITKEEDGLYYANYTYGFDNANYGLKTLKTPLPATATVDFTAQAEGAFLMAPQFDVEVSALLAESYGYTDSCGIQVSALDVLVKAHELMFGDEFTAETAQTFLAVTESGFVTTIFGVETSANGFFVNKGYPNDGTESPYGGFNGTTVTTQEIDSGDLLEFFLYQDDQYYSDAYIWLDLPETILADADITVHATGFYAMSAYLYGTPETLKEAALTRLARNRNLAWVNLETGELTPIDNSKINSSGDVVITVPNEAGTYYLTAVTNGSNYAILSLTTVTVLPHTHVWFASDVTKAATCTETGEQQYICPVCNKVKTEQLPKIPHDYEATLTDPTCETMGYTTYTCTVCGDSYKADYVDATGHNYDDGQVTKEPTCTEEGVRTFTCEVCGATQTEAIEKVPHSYEAAVTAPTCETMGYTTYTCTACGDSYKADYVDATGHSYDDGQVTKEPTCTEEGIKTFTCAACGKSYTQPVAKLAHDYTTTVTAPTCDSMGYTTHTCAVCGDSYVDTIVAALGHKYVSTVTAPTCDEMGYTTHTCSVCGDTYVDSYTQALEHSYEQTVTKEPTCTAEGELTFTCADCGKTYTQVLPKTDHSCTATVVEPTCVGYGYTEYKCENCDYSYIANLVQPTGHDYKVVNAKEATCTEDGYTGDLVCSVCDDVKQTGDVIPATGHTWGEWETTEEATCFTSGEEAHTCSVCGETETREIPANSDNCPSKAFSDLDTGAWYHEGVDFVLQTGLMVGTAADKFSPNGTVTRGQLVAILYRLAEKPDVEDLTNTFTDVDPDAYYADAVLWAEHNGIVFGVGNDCFNPDGEVTRQDMVAILYRYAAFAEYDVTVDGDLSGFPDAGDVAAYAEKAMTWAVSNGLISGTTSGNDTILAPLATSTRAQLAAVMQRLVEKDVEP